jgi:hypothetical protein
MTDGLVISDGIVAEEFDGEIVLIDAVRGLYFSLQGAAMELWRAFAAERAVADVLDAFCAQVAGADRDALREVIGRMRENDLLVPAMRAPSTSAPAMRVLSLTFAPPVLEVYSDLAELIAIDPVHEVDAAAGWPLRPANFPDVS